MSEAIIVALISGGLALIGTVISCTVSGRKMTSEIDKRQAITDVKLEQLTQHVREHNHYAKLFAETMPVVQEQIKIINHRLKDIEKNKEE